MITLESVKNKLFGNTDHISTERYFMSVTTLVTAIFLAILCMVHIVIGLHLKPVMIAGSSSILLLCLYYFVRVKNVVFIPKLILTIVGLIMLDVTWYLKYLSNGPVLLFVLMFAALVLWVWEGKQLRLLLIFYFVNITILFYIDYHAPQARFEYPDLKKRSIDIFVSLFTYSVFLIFLLYVVKKEFLKQKERAVTSDKLKSSFLANMSHEIRTPMNGILGFMELLKLPSLNDNMRDEYVKIIEQSGHRMLNILNNIVDISKIESGQMKTLLVETNIKEQLGHVYNFFRTEIEDKKINFYISNNLPNEETIIKTDKEKLNAILINLVKNAIKYTDSGTIQIRCDLVSEINSVQFSVKDTGIGIAKDKLSDIFKHFVQADITNIMARQGAGLGLSITKAYVDLLGGKIWLKSEEGKGTTFYFTLPNNIKTSSFNDKLMKMKNKKK